MNKKYYLTKFINIIKYNKIKTFRYSIILRLATISINMSYRVNTCTIIHIKDYQIP